MRSSIASVGPVVDDIRADLDLSAVEASFLTALPLICFAGGAVIAPHLARRWGAPSVLAAVFAATGGGLVWRATFGTAALFGGTLLSGAAIAIANVLLPAVVKREFARWTGAVMGLYIGTTAAMAAMAARVTVPVSQVSRYGWRAGLAIWAPPAGVAAAAWLLLARGSREPGDSGPLGATPSGIASFPLRNDRVAWHVTIFMALQSMVFYSLLSWLPSIYRSSGLDAQAAGEQLSMMLLIGIPIAIAGPSLFTRSTKQSAWSVVAVTFIATGVSGLLFAPGYAPTAWTLLVGAGTGIAFPLTLTLMVLRARLSDDAANLSSMSQSIGYALGALGPFLFGALRDVSGDWRLPLACMLFLLLPLAASGMGAGKDVYVRSSPPPRL